MPARHQQPQFRALIVQRHCHRIGAIQVFQVVENQENRPHRLQVPLDSADGRQIVLSNVQDMRDFAGDLAGGGQRDQRQEQGRPARQPLHLMRDMKGEPSLA